MTGFDSPFALVGLLVVPLALGVYLLAQRRPARYALRYTNLEVLGEVVDTRSPWRRRVVVGLWLGALAFLCLAVARPTLTTFGAQKGATIVLVVDTSRSMEAGDVSPTRFGAAKEAMEDFLNRVPRSVRVGLVSFSDEPRVTVSPTTDHHRVRVGVELLTLGGGTAIGDSLARAVAIGRPARLKGRARARRRPTSAIVLVSDGTQTRGTLTPLKGARRAMRANMPVYTIALGTDNGTVELRTIDERKRIPTAPPDRATLAEIATMTRGGFFDAPTAVRLRTIYGDLGASISRVERRRELTVGAVAASLALLVSAAIVAGASRLHVH